MCVSQIRAANSLLSITHSMKLLLLLSDEAQIAHRRDAELKNLWEERDDAKEKIALLLDELLRPSKSESGLVASDD
jgi:mediator of RNA polymerase II transcription subunit 22